MKNLYSIIIFILILSGFHYSMGQVKIWEKSNRNYGTIGESYHKSVLILKDSIHFVWITETLSSNQKALLSSEEVSGTFSVEKDTIILSSIEPLPIHQFLIKGRRIIYLLRDFPRKWKTGKRFWKRVY